MNHQKTWSLLEVLEVLSKVNHDSKSLLKIKSLFECKFQCRGIYNKFRDFETIGLKPNIV